MAEEHRARRQGAFLATAHGGSCNAGHPLLPPAAVDCSSRSDGPLSATVCCHRVRSTIGVFLGIEPPGGRCRKLRWSVHRILRQIAEPTWKVPPHNVWLWRLKDEHRK